MITGTFFDKESKVEGSNVLLACRICFDVGSSWHNGFKVQASAWSCTGGRNLSPVSRQKAATSVRKRRSSKLLVLLGTTGWSSGLLVHNA